MKELSLNVLDITQNSVTAGAANVNISLVEDEKGILTLTIEDDGCGMTEETVARVTNPFYTTRTTRRVGMGLPLLKLAAEQTGGTLSVTSSVRPEDHGTTVKASFDTRHIDFTPVGDMVSTMTTIIQGHPEVHFVYLHKTPRFEVRLDTAELLAVLGEGISLSAPDVIAWIGAYLTQQYSEE